MYFFGVKSAIMKGSLQRRCRPKPAIAGMMRKRYKILHQDTIWKRNTWEELPSSSSRAISNTCDKYYTISELRP